MSSETIEQAIQLIRAGDKKAGGKLLAEVVKQDPQNETAWLWLAGCFDNEEKKKFCLKKALEINPGNTRAWEALQKLSEEEINWENRMNRVIETDPETELANELKSSGLIRGVTVFDAEPAPAPPPPDEKQFEQTASFTRVFFIGALILIGASAVTIYVLISSGVLFPPSPERTYAKEMRSVLSSYNAWTTTQAQFEAALAAPYTGELSASGSSALTHENALNFYLALLIEPSEEINSYKARLELANALQPDSQAAYEQGQAILSALQTAQPPDEIRTAHQQFFNCVQQQTRRALAVNQIVTSGIASTGYSVNPEVCAPLPNALAALQKYSREH